MADMCGFLSTLHVRQGLMADEATRRQVVLSPAEFKEVERSPLGAEVLFWVLEVYDEGGNPRDPTRIAMAEAVFKKVAEDRPCRQAWDCDPRLLPHLWGWYPDPPQGPR